jgi:hypothetical protein
VGETASDDLFGKNIEHIIDWVRGLCNDSRRNVSEAASMCLKVLVQSIAERVRWGSLEAQLYSGGKSGFDLSAENYLWLASTCCYFPDMSILNLNYDSILEWAFERISLAPPFSQQRSNWQSFPKNPDASPQSGGVYLKLHGSLDLHDCLNPNCKSFRNPIYSGLNYSTGTIRGCGVPLPVPDEDGVCEGPECRVCHQPMSPLILPPGKNKTRAEGMFHGYLYRLAERALEKANAWIIIGYSCPTYDADIADMLRNSIKTRPEYPSEPRSIWMISPDAQSISQRLSELLEYPAGAANQGFSQFIDRVLQLEGRERPGLA